MPTRPPTFNQLLRGGNADGNRPSARARGYTRSWEKASKAFLKQNPLCAHCEAETNSTGPVVLAVLVDHIIPHRGNLVLFWDEKNWQGLCRRHHDIKTASGA